MAYKKLIFLIFPVFLLIYFGSFVSALYDYSPDGKLVNVGDDGPSIIEKEREQVSLMDYPECTSDLSSSTTSTCMVSNDLKLIPGNYNVWKIYILEDNVTLDCNGAHLYCEDDYLVTIAAKNVVVKNCNFHNYYAGVLIWEHDFDNFTIYNNVFFDGFAGIYAEGGPFNTNISKNYFNSTFYGIAIHEKELRWGNIYDRSDFHGTTLIDGNIFYDNYMGIQAFENPRNLKISNNFISPTDIYSAGIVIGNNQNTEPLDNDVGNIYIENNKIFYCRHGIYINFDDNSSWECGPNQEKVYIYDNDIAHSAEQTGMHLLKSPKETYLYRNKIHNNTYGIGMSTLTKNETFYLNDIYDNDYGISAWWWYHGGKFYLNNLYSNIDDFRGGWGELSYEGLGNYWGRSFPPCFCEYGNTEPNCSLNGDGPTDTYDVDDAQDSYAYCASSPPKIQNIDFPNYGWYFIGLNVLPLDSRPMEVFKTISSKYSTIKSYFGGETKIYTPSSPFNTLNSIEPWYGYWIKYTGTKDSVLSVIGEPITDCHNLNLKRTPVAHHWIGYWLGEETGITTALSSISGKYAWIRTYEDGQWKSYLPGLPQFSDLTRMKPGQGYLIEMVNEGNLDYFCG